MMLAMLARASLDCTLIAAMVWGINRTIPNLPSAARALLWWCVAAKFVAMLVWTTPVLLPVLPAPEAVAIPAVISQSPNATARNVESSQPRAGIVARLPRPDWTVLLLAAWISGSVLMMARSLRRWRTIRRAVADAVPADGNTHLAVGELAGQMRLARLPEIRRSTVVTTPLVTGLSRPVILLPSAAFERLTDRQRRLVLAHELTHVKRADLWLGFIPALAERLFFFHPVAHLAAREYAFWREAACDASVLEMLDAAPQEYGALLLDLGVTRRAASFTAAGAPWSFSVLKRRIIMLQEHSPRSMAARLTAAVAIAVAVAAIAPLRLSARPATSPSSITFTDVPPTSVPAIEQDRARKSREQLNYVYFITDDNTNMSGSSKDIQRARTFKRRGEPMLWFKTDAGEYIVRDRSILDQIEQLWEPVQEIGAEQGKVGAKQGEIGASQGKIGQQQGVVGAQQGLVGARQSEVGAQQGALAEREWRKLTDAEKKALDQKRRDLDDRMRELDVEMRKLDVRMRELDQPMSELNERMKELDKEMSALDARMKVAVEKAEDAMRQLLERAISSGAAQNVK